MFLHDGNFLAFALFVRKKFKKWSCNELTKINGTAMRALGLGTPKVFGTKMTAIAHLPPPYSLIIITKVEGFQSTLFLFSLRIRSTFPIGIPTSHHHFSFSIFFFSSLFGRASVTP